MSGKSSGSSGGGSKSSGGSSSSSSRSSGGSLERSSASSSKSSTSSSRMERSSKSSTSSSRMERSSSSSKLEKSSSQSKKVEQSGTKSTGSGYRSASGYERSSTAKKSETASKVENTGKKIENTGKKSGSGASAETKGSAYNSATSFDRTTTRETPKPQGTKSAETKASKGYKEAGSYSRTGKVEGTAVKTDTKAEAKGDVKKTEPKVEAKIDVKTTQTKEVTRTGNKVEATKTTTKVETRTDVKKPDSKVEAKADAKKTEAKVEPKADAKKTEAKVENKTDVKKPEPKVENKTDVKKPEPKVENKTDVKKPEPKVEAKTDVKKPDPKAETKADAKKTEAKAEAKADAKRAEAKVEAKTDVKKAEAKVEAKTDVKKAEPKAESKPDTKKTEAKIEPKADTKNTESKVEAKTGVKNTEAKVEAKAGAKKTEAKVEAKTDAKKTEPKVEAKAENKKPESKLESQAAKVNEITQKNHEKSEKLLDDSLKKAYEGQPEKYEQMREFVDKHKEVTQPYYDKSVDIAKHTPELVTYSDHNIAHPNEVTASVAQNMGQIKEFEKANNVPENARIKDSVVIGSAIYHDTGMAGSKEHQAELQRNPNVVFEGDKGESIRKNHHAESANRILENADKFSSKDEAIETAWVTYLHTKSKSGVPDLGDAGTMTASLNQVKENYEKANPNAEKLNLSSFGKTDDAGRLTEVDPQVHIRVANEALTVRVGDAQRPASEQPLTMTGRVMECEKTTYGDDSRFTTSLADEVKGKRVEYTDPANPDNKIAGSDNLYALMYTTGERNVDAGAMTFTSDGKMEVSYVVKDAKADQAATMAVLLNRMEEADTAASTETCRSGMISAADIVHVVQIEKGTEEDRKALDDALNPKHSLRENRIRVLLKQ